MDETVFERQAQACKTQAQERNLTIEDLNQSIRSKWVILWAEV